MQINDAQLVRQSILYNNVSLQGTAQHGSLPKPRQYNCEQMLGRGKKIFTVGAKELVPLVFRSSDGASSPNLLMYRTY